MRRIVYALVLLIASSAPVFGITDASADEQCVWVRTTDTVTSYANAYVEECVPPDVPPANATCQDEGTGASNSDLGGTIGVAVGAHVCVPD